MTGHRQQASRCRWNSTQLSASPTGVQIGPAQIIWRGGSIFAQAVASVCIVLSVFSSTISAAEPTIEITATVDFGRDVGQNFGTLFEAHDKTGRLTFGAGFVGVYNTRYRADRYQLQFFVRPTGPQAEHVVREQMPSSTSDSGVYLYGLDGTVFAEANGLDGATRRWDAAQQHWVDVPTVERNEFGATLVRGKELAIRSGRLLYDGKVILDQAQQGRYLRPYYARGMLFFYHQFAGTAGAEPETAAFNHVYAVPWNAYDADLNVDLTKAVFLSTKYPREFPYAYGQLGEQVLSCSNIGGVYAFDGESWRVLVAPNDKVSYQVYSIININDRLLLGHYPTGELLEFDGKTVARKPGWPPVLPGVSDRAREAQTTMIYRGELCVGVWPWAELWRWDPDGPSWSSLGRMMTQPELTAKAIHPYEDIAQQAGIVGNGLGQRLTSFVPDGDGLIIGTSSKAGGAWTAKTQELLSPEVRAEYGAIHRWKLPGNLAASIQWHDRPIQLRFQLKNDRMTIWQDGERLSTAKLESFQLPAANDVTLKTGQGIFGAYSGDNLQIDR